MTTAFEKAQLIAYISGEDIGKVRLYPDEIDYDKDKLQELLSRAEKGESIARIIGKRGFWRDEFFIENTLEPRADSETLIEAVLENFPDKENKLKILDIGTGSGCLILSLLQEYKNASGLAMDKSEKALATAKKNANALGLENRCQFIEKNLFHELPADEFDILISNPPYIKTEDIETLEPIVKNHDPKMSLDGGKDGLDPYRSILEKSQTKHLFFEIGMGQEGDIENIATKHNYTLKKSYKDFGGIIRILYFVKV